MLLWLWCRPAAIAPIRPLAWEPPYATGAALKRQKDQKKKKKRNEWLDEFSEHSDGARSQMKKEHITGVPHNPSQALILLRPWNVNKKETLKKNTCLFQCCAPDTLYIHCSSFFCLLKLYLFVCFCLFRAAPSAYGSSQARG